MPIEPFRKVPENLREWSQYFRDAKVVADSAIVADTATVADSTTGTASNVTGVVAVVNGGTGSTTAATSRTALGLGTAATQNTGTSGANVPLLNGTNVHASGQFTAFGIGTTAVRQAANADTSGATLAQLETEVNELKALMRTFGFIS